MDTTDNTIKPSDTMDDTRVSEVHQMTPVYTYDGRIGLEEMEQMRKNLDPNAFSAPLNQGELSSLDKFNLIFLIAFPCLFFVLGIVLTAVLK